MKKVALSIVLVSTLLFATDNTKRDCVENFQNEIFNILNQDKPKEEKEKAISEVNKNMVEACDPLPTVEPAKQTETEDCIENFENDVMKIILEEPEESKKKEAIKGVYKSYKEKCDGKF